MRYLFVGSHYDDIELGAGGTLAKIIAEGHEGYCIITSDSAGGSRDSSVAIREGENALLKLGVLTHNIIKLPFADTEVPYNREIIKSIEENISNIKPDFIFTHFLNDSHQDHVNTAKAVMSASRYQKNILMFEPQYPSTLSNTEFHPAIYIDISNYLVKKIKAIQCHTSQIKVHPWWIDQIQSMGKIRGIEIRVNYAEAFEPIRMELK